MVNHTVVVVEVAGGQEIGDSRDDNDRVRGLGLGEGVPEKYQISCLGVSNGAVLRVRT